MYYHLPILLVWICNKIGAPRLLYITADNRKENVGEMELNVVIRVEDKRFEAVSYGTQYSIELKYMNSTSYLRSFDNMAIT
jgi:hypothetical protein